MRPLAAHQLHWLSVVGVGSLWGVLSLLGSLGSAGGSATPICGPGLNTPGVTLPKGDIVIEHGNPLEILCVLDPNHAMSAGRTSADLVFYHNERRVPSGLVSVVNETTIRLFVEKPPPSNSMYYCKLANSSGNEEAVCLNAVAIAFKPQEVVNFTCISHNWENLTCTWSKPENHVKTQYTIRYRLPGRAGGRLLYGCPNNTDVKESRCFWDMTTDPHYRQPYEYYYFTMSGENLLGNITFPVIKFHHYTHVLPASPSNLSLVNRTSDSVGLDWKIPFPMQIFPPGVIHKVRYQSQWDTRDFWHELALNLSSKPGQNAGRYENLTGLTHANAIYDIRVYIKSAAATVGPDMWSLPANLTVKTAPKAPGEAPRTDVGSFEVSGGPSREVYVYWRHIPEVLKNGDNFEYRVFRVFGSQEEPLVPVESTKAYSKFQNLDLTGHRLKVVSANKEGESHDHSTVFIPALGEAPPEPVAFTKIAFGGGVYELSWKAANLSQNRIDNYTIFWCDNDRDRPYQCTGLLDWIHVGSNTTVKRIHVAEEKIFQFAISANSAWGSSGMVWASCTVIHDKIVGKMKNVWINKIDDRSVEVGWKLDCSDRAGMVTGFLITFCPIVGPQQIKCKEPEQSVTVQGDPSTIRGTVCCLRPYTTYMVSVSVLTKSGGGQQSVPLLITTLEAAPEIPRDVTVSQVTNNSILVSWLPPAISNGVLRVYQVMVDQHMHKVEQVNNSLLLSNLTSFHNYSVKVCACTGKCSNYSQPIVVRTAVGVPSVIDRPTVKLLNASLASVHWRRPIHAAGNLDVYEVMFQQRGSAGNTSTQIYRSSEMEMQIPVPECKADAKSRLTYSFLVRAINVGPDNASLAADWSEPGETSCYNADAGRQKVVIIWVSSVIIACLLCALLGYAGRRAWQRCKLMSDVEVRLPAGLTPHNEKDAGKMHVHAWPGACVTDTQHSASADEELLLHKTERHERTGSAGGSSGHDSVSSSRTSAHSGNSGSGHSGTTNMSSDSGTEQDPRPGSPDGVFCESPSWPHVAPLTVCVDGSYVRMGKLDGYVSSEPPETLEPLEPLDLELARLEGVGYCRVGLEPGKGYVSIANLPPSSGATGTSVPPKEAYCRMGAALPHGYVSLPDSAGRVPACPDQEEPDPDPDPDPDLDLDEAPLPSRPQVGGYVPHARFDKLEANV